MSKKVVILGTAHGSNVGGKCSPDKKFREFRYSREIISILKPKLEELGFLVFIDIPDDIVPLPQKSELSKRCSIVNNICAKYGKANCIYVSIHCNAAGSDGKWHTAGGWCVYTSKGKTKADTLAERICEAAEIYLSDYAEIMKEGKKKGIYDSKQRAFRWDMVDGDKDQEADFYVLAHTACPAVLSENLFQDNQSDVAYLESEKGKSAIIQAHIEGIKKYFGV